MAGKFVCLITVLLVIYEVQCQGPPKLNESFIAWGEVVQPADDDEVDGILLPTIQTAFEESYDAKTGNAAFFLYEVGQNLTFFKNFKTNQTFLYMQNNASHLQCSESTELQWKEAGFTRGLLSFEDDDKTVKFSLHQLLNIPEIYMKKSEKQGAKTTYRGIPAKTWYYEINLKDDDDGATSKLTVRSFWSDGSWNTSAGTRMTPLGFNMTFSKHHPKDKSKDDHTHGVLNVYGFIHDAYDHKYFKPIEGVICASRKKTLPFPRVRNLKAISLHSEMLWPEEQEVRYVDTWFDPSNQLVRVDLERLDDRTAIDDDMADKIGEKTKAYQSEIAIGQMGVVFRWGWYKGQSHCEVIPFKDYTNDMQNLFDIKQDLKNWKMGKLFGLNDTSYTYIGQTTKNDVPCHLFQGVRTDWPDKASGYQTLWEWCFNVNMTKGDIMLFQGGEFGLLNVNIWILSDPKNVFPFKYRLAHHFYDVKEQDPKVLDATSFDIGKCFRYNQTRRIQFYLDMLVTDDNKHLLENATGDVEFLRRWKTAIYSASGLPEYSLRISNLRATIDGNKLYIKFSLLDIHDSLPSDVKKKQISLSDAQSKLSANVNEGKVSISYAFRKGNVTTLAASKQSVSDQIDPNIRPRTLPPITYPTPKTFPTKFPFSLATEPDKVTTTSPTVGKQESWTGHKPGTVAGVSIAMLLVGISIGASGTFYKFNGLPSCMRR